MKLIQEHAQWAELFASAVNSGIRTCKVNGRENVDGLEGLKDGAVGLYRVGQTAVTLSSQLHARQVTINFIAACAHIVWARKLN